MFRKSLEAKLKAIFQMSKVSFDQPSESYEQDTLFVEITQAPSVAKPGLATCKVSGSIVLFTQHDKTPYGFFIKKIEQAEATDVKPFFFYDTDVDALNSPARLVNISERRCRFIFLYEEQYDPNHGELTELEL